MSYLICEECGGYYKLQKSEKSDNDNCCQCGGKLKHYKYIHDFLGKENALKHLKGLNEDISHEKEGYLVCVECGSYYKLQDCKETNPEFCGCRGKLTYYKSMDDYWNEKSMFKHFKDQNNPRLIAKKEFDNLSGNEKLLMEIELYNLIKGENIEATKNLRNGLMVEGLIIIILGIMGTFTISYAFYLFLMAISTIFFGAMLLKFSMGKYYNRSKLRQILLLNALNLALSCVVCVIFIILSLLQGNYYLFIESSFSWDYDAPISAIIFFAMIYGSFSYAILSQSTIPDYYNDYERKIPLDNQTHHIDKHNPYGKRKR